MQISQFAATCPLEIGDSVPYGGKHRIITDIACTHYLKTGRIDFSVELDNSGRYLKLGFSKKAKDGVQR